MPSSAMVCANIPKSWRRRMGDAESTVERFCMRTLEPGVGKKWFSADGAERESH